MAETPVRQGYALRVYQILLVLALGWLAGRWPDLVAENARERAMLEQAIGLERPAFASSPPQDETVLLAADVAARVAAQVADETIQRLIAAGWGPREAGPLPVVAQAGPPRETVVRVVSEAAPAAPMWSLPLAAPAPEARAVPVPPAPAPPPVDAAGARAHVVATNGYAALQAGDRRRAVALLTEAVRIAPDAPGATQWAADARQLTRRWSVAGYVLSRGGGVGDPLAASPVLGGGQAGAAVGYTLNPLGEARVTLMGRLSAAAGPNGGLDGETAEAALGVRVQPFRRVPVAVDVERRFALGTYSRDAWAARLSGGASGEAKLAGRRLMLEGYGEAGVIGFDEEPALYAGAQLRGATPVMALGKVAMNAGGGVWGAAQRDYGLTVSRLDVGPSAQFQVQPWPFRAQLDYRFRAAGNALPGSGPVVTVAGEF
ncbi:hypothetical protein L6Q21_15690 [Sandaracinobacter sp. RS1-74]|uniref:hypothetical protein n=1 Tax=Sandaracinobacteroides sayramensis TaxID=2913411 RepID=UPI001EDAC47E|nr:hypothetical protein [Sandaracinobacteroides sayramensis]MCG2842420.1 hypothetical protein [Sandaracinobacteroides sayramensis]